MVKHRNLYETLHTFSAFLHPGEYQRKPIRIVPDKVSKGRVTQLKKKIVMTTAVWLGMVCTGISAPRSEGSPKITDAHRFLQESSEPLSTKEQRSSTLDDVIIPEKTEMFLNLQQSISTKAAGPGYKFFGRLVVPVTANDQIVLPVGTFVIGHVLAAHEPGYLKGSAELLLAFDSIILPNGTTRQIEAVVLSAEGLKSDPTDEQGTLQAPGNQGEETVSGATRGAVLGGVVGAVSGRDLKGLGVGAVIGSAAGALIGLFKKGDDAELRKGTTVTIQLRSDIRFVRLPARNPSRVPMSR